MRAGLYYGSALIYASARDFAKFGLLYLRDGMWDGQRVLPEGWVDFARTAGKSENADIYGAGWWVTPAEGDGRPYQIAHRYRSATRRVQRGGLRRAVHADRAVEGSDHRAARIHAGEGPAQRRDPRVAGPSRARVPGGGARNGSEFPVRSGFSPTSPARTLSSTTLPRRSTRSGTSRCASSTVSSRCR